MLGAVSTPGMGRSLLQAEQRHEGWEREGISPLVQAGTEGGGWGSVKHSIRARTSSMSAPEPASLLQTDAAALLPGTDGGRRDSVPFSDSGVTSHLSTLSCTKQRIHCHHLPHLIGGQITATWLHFQWEQEI